MALKNESVVQQWNTLIENGAGRGKWVMEQIERKLKEANIPGAYIRTAEISSGGMFGGTKREFLIISTESLPDFYLYIAARDYASYLDVSWYLTVEPVGLKRAFSKYSMGNPLAMSMQLDFFRQQDANAFVTVVHGAVKDTVEELHKELGQTPANFNTQSKGFLSVW